MFGSIQVAQQRDLGAVVQHLLVDPPNDVEEWLLGVTAVGVGAMSEMLAGRGDWTVGAHAFPSSMNPLAASVTTTRLGRAELRSGPVRR